MDLKRLAKLSRLTFTPEEEARFGAEMERIVAMVAQLPDLDASGPLIDPDNPMEFRKDEAEHRFTRQELLQNAPEVQAGCIVVPKMVD
ncbi:MAG: Asp-tRNA(Asn)/Glu-tRNA(Gln) amidotransferase subunit GatC [Oscillospiraceae bacterium]|nr:Asp-tRNA(Asn)/Glu-tRNA(Gln) amidotransferase subunit GatC [Oscillospiraceae bacterium]